MNYALNVSTQVRDIIQPIIKEMTSIHLSEKMQPMLMTTPQQEPPHIKQIKSRCVHYIIENNTIVTALDWEDDHGTPVLKCKACGRKINTKFDKAAVDTLTESIAIINSLLTILLTNGVRPEVCSTLLSLKTTMPEVVQLCQTLNEYVRQDEKNSEPERNMGIYKQFQSNPLTGF